MIEKIKNSFRKVFLRAEPSSLLMLCTLVAISVSLLVLVYSLEIAKPIIRRTAKSHAVFALALLLMPFLISLGIEYKICQKNFNNILLRNLSDTGLEKTCRRFADTLSFLIAVCIAFLIFLKSSIYELLGLSGNDHFAIDVLAGWLIFSCTVIKITFESALLVRHEQQNAKSKKAITEQRRSQRIVVYSKRVYCTHKHRQQYPNFKASCSAEVFPPLKCDDCRK